MGASRRKMPDVVYENKGTLFQFFCNGSATEWVRENVQVPDDMWNTPQSFLCQHEHADMLIAGMEEAGFNVVEG